MSVALHVRPGDLGAKVQPLHDRSNRRDDWHASSHDTDDVTQAPSSGGLLIGLFFEPAKPCE
jgi:hypothetical protein